MANALAAFVGKGKKKKVADEDEDDLDLEKDGAEEEVDDSTEEEATDDLGMDDNAFASEDVDAQDAQVVDAEEDKPAHAALPALVDQLAEGDWDDSDSDVVDAAAEEELSEASGEVESPEVQAAEEALGTEAHDDEVSLEGPGATQTALSNASDVFSGIADSLESGVEIGEDALTSIEEALDEIATAALEESGALSDGKAIKEEIAKRKDRGAILAQFAKLMG